MRKTFFRTFSLLMFAVLLTAVSAQAQTRGSYEAEIPFDFAIGNESYEAGEYLIKIKSPNYLANVLTISTAKGSELQATAVVSNGDRAKKNEARLVFDRFGDHYTLRKIVAPRFGFSTRKSKEVITIRIENDEPAESQTVSVLLKKRE